MRLVPFLITLVVTIIIVFLLNIKLGSIPPLGRFLSPQHGIWQNAEPVSFDYSGELDLDGLAANVEIFFDERLIPHVFAESDEDAYFAQGYLHAKFRLFQMDIQTKAAAGRASEVAGEVALNFDREQRRLGMLYAAELALEEMEKDPASKKLFDAYTSGVNAWIDNLKEADLPIEYKILDIRPERWSNLRTALLLKMMAKMLSGGTEHDIETTNARLIFLPDELRILYPEIQDSLVPIIPSGTPFPAPGIIPKSPENADSAYYQFRDSLRKVEISKPDPSNGSNNWVVAGSKTQSGSPILCNDPHLELSLPSIWYEMQIVTPNSNCYGVSLPGSPFIIIGFNDQIAWGVTNSQRDVKDYYTIRYRDSLRTDFWYRGQWDSISFFRYEKIRIRGGEDFIDTVAYTPFGPVMYDHTFYTEETKGVNLAVRWAAHDPSNEGLTFYRLNRATNYDEYEIAISSFACPGQNFVFASKSGDIAIRQQGRFPARWEGQGLMVMPGEDSSYMWQGFIPQKENPAIKNPASGYIQSANQRPVDSSYPYFIPGTYITPRGISIDRKLKTITAATPKDMMDLQQDYFNSLAEDARPLLLKYIQGVQLGADESRFVEKLRTWDLLASPDSEEQTIFQTWWDSVEVDLWKDELSSHQLPFYWPTEQTTVELLLRDSAVKYIDNINTEKKETLQDIIYGALKRATLDLRKREDAGVLAWAKFKNVSIYHLLKQPLLAFARTGLNVGGNGNIINAVTHSHGPSWRMVVHLTDQTEAYGVYPGGQNGNPGSPHYDTFVNDWVVGNYYPLWYMRAGDKLDKKVKWKMVLN